MKTKEDYLAFLADVRKASGVDSFVSDESEFVAFAHVGGGDLVNRMGNEIMIDAKDLV